MINLSNTIPIIDIWSYQCPIQYSIILYWDEVSCVSAIPGAFAFEGISTAKADFPKGKENTSRSSPKAVQIL
jgi:hypothetical protein